MLRHCLLVLVLVQGVRGMRTLSFGNRDWLIKMIAAVLIVDLRGGLWFACICARMIEHRDRLVG